MHLHDGMFVGDLNAGELAQAGAIFPRRAIRRKRRKARKARRASRRATAPQVIVVHSNKGSSNNEPIEYEDDGDDDASDGLVYVGSLPASTVWGKPQHGSWEPRGIGDFRTSSVYSRRPEERRYMGEAIPTMVGGLPFKPVWGLHDKPQWDPRGIGDFRTSQVYSQTGDRRYYQGEAIPTMVGDLSGMVPLNRGVQSGTMFMLGAAKRRSAAMRAAAEEAETLDTEATEGMMLIAGPSIGFLR